MAIMVTDPRNNLLSQLTAVGQQYLAGKQQERMSAMDFANRKSLIELMDRLGGQADVREFGQEKELLDLQTKAQAGILDAAGRQRLAEITAEVEGRKALAEIQGRYGVQAVEAGKPAPLDIPGTIQALQSLFPKAESTALPPLTPEIRKTILDMGGEDALRAVVGALDDPVKLRDLMVETEGNPLGVMLSTLRTPGSPRNKAVVDFFNARADSLEAQGKKAAANDLQMQNTAGLLNFIAPLLMPNR